MGAPRRSAVNSGKLCTKNPARAKVSARICDASTTPSPPRPASSISFMSTSVSARALRHGIRENAEGRSVVLTGARRCDSVVGASGHSRNGADYGTRDLRLDHHPDPEGIPGKASTNALKSASSKKPCRAFRSGRWRMSGAELRRLRSTASLNA